MRPHEAEEIWRRYGQAVFGAAWRVTLEAHAAEDAAQEAFARLLQNPPPSGTNLPAWLKRVAINAAIDGLRSRRRLVMLKGEFTAEAPPDLELGDELLAALRRLPPDQRAAVLCVDRDSLTYEDAARLLGVTAAKLRTDLCRGRQALLELLGPAQEKERRA